LETQNAWRCQRLSAVVPGVQTASDDVPLMSGVSSHSYDRPDRKDRQDLPPGRRATSIMAAAMTTGDARLKSQLGAGRRHEPVSLSLDLFESLPAR
jgi:hypothetical protein